MPFSEHSLLLAIVFTDVAIIILLTTTWLSSGIEPFLRTWLVGIVISLVGTFASAVFYMKPELWVGAISFGALAVGFSVNALAAFQFRTGRLPLPLLRTASFWSWRWQRSLRCCRAVIGLSLIIWQAWGAVCGAAAAVNYWMAGEEAPVALTILALFYLALGIPYALSAGIIILDGKHVPSAARRTTGRTRHRASSLS